MSSEPRQQGKYLVIFKRATGTGKRRRKVEGDISLVEPGDVVSWHDGCGRSSAFVKLAASSARKVKTAPQEFMGYLLKPSVVLTFDRIIEVLRPNHESVKMPPPKRKALVVPQEHTEEELERERKLAEAKKKDEARRRKKAAAFRKKQAAEAKVKRAEAKAKRLAELKSGSTMD